MAEALILTWMKLVAGALFSYIVTVTGRVARGQSDGMSMGVRLAIIALMGVPLVLMPLAGGR